MVLPAGDYVCGVTYWRLCMWCYLLETVCGVTCWRLCMMCYLPETMYDVLPAGDYV